MYTYRKFQSALTLIIIFALNLSGCGPGSAATTTNTTPNQPAKQVATSNNKVNKNSPAPTANQNVAGTTQNKTSSNGSGNVFTNWMPSFSSSTETPTPPTPIPSPKIIITSIPLRIAISASAIVLEVVTERFLGVKVDYKSLIDSVVESPDAIEDAPPSSKPVLMLVSKKNNQMMYWVLTDNVKMIHLHDKNPGAIDLKVINEQPLRVELWIDGDVKDVQIDLELKN